MSATASATGSGSSVFGNLASIAFMRLVTATATVLKVFEGKSEELGDD
jgi:hypothetical protein